MQAHDIMPFTKLINVDQGARKHFHVPTYQREYTWKKCHWERLLNDIKNNNPGYFMGSIICMNDARTISAGDKLIFEVLDGHQRLTTLSLLLAAIYSKLTSAMDGYEPADEQDRKEVRSCITNIRAKLIKHKKGARSGEAGAFKVGKNVYFLRVQPSAKNHNLADYLYLLGKAGVIESQPKQPYCGNRLLGRAYANFQEKIFVERPLAHGSRHAASRGSRLGMRDLRAFFDAGAIVGRLSRGVERLPGDAGRIVDP